MTRAAGISRHYGLDWLRIGAFVLLVLYDLGAQIDPLRPLIGLSAKLRIRPTLAAA